jgi:hypothetical protein
MLFPCFTVFKSLYELTGDPQRKAWNLATFRRKIARSE